MSIFFQTFIVNGQTISDKGTLMPLAIGNYWVYSNTFDHKRLDTIKIIDKFSFKNSDAVFVLNDGLILFNYKDTSDQVSNATFYLN